MALNETDIKIIVLVILIVWFRLLYMSLEAKSLLCLTILLFPGFPLMIFVLNATWGPAFGELLASAG
jgi:hypothetical protein